MIFLKYNNGTSVAFQELSWFSSLQSEAASGTTLRGNLYQHQLYARRLYTITLSADAIDDVTKLDFLEAFFLSNNKQLSFDNSNFVDVVADAGDLPISWIEDVRFLPEITFTLRRKAPVVTRMTGEDSMNTLP